MGNTIKYGNILDFFTEMSDYNGKDIISPQSFLTNQVFEKDYTSNRYALSFSSIDVLNDYAHFYISFSGQGNFLSFNFTLDGTETNFTTDLDVPFTPEFVSIGIGYMNLYNIKIEPDSGVYVEPKPDRNLIQEVVKESVISADVMMSNNAWIRSLSVEELSTNFWDISPLNLNHQGKTGTFNRNYIQIKENKIDFIQETRSYDELDFYTVQFPDGRIDNIYWTAVGDHPEAYLYFTTTSPGTIYPDLAIGEREKYNVMIYKLVGTPLVKLSIEFNSDGEPQITYGKNSDPSFGALTQIKTGVDAKRTWHKFIETINPNGEIKYDIFNNANATDLITSFKVGLDGIVGSINADGRVGSLSIDAFESCLTHSKNGFKTGFIATENVSQMVTQAGSVYESSATLTDTGMTIQAGSPNIATKSIRNITAGTTLPDVKSFNEGDIFFLI